MILLIVSSAVKDVNNTKQRSLIKVKCPFFLRNQLSITQLRANNASTNALQFTECWICPETYFSKYSKTWILKKHLHRTSLRLFWEHIYFYSRALQRICESSFHGWCRHLLFFHSVAEVKTYCTFYLINIASYLQKPMRLLNSYGTRFRPKKNPLQRS